jgi:hypothetical protein
VPRARLNGCDGKRTEWKSRALPNYQRRTLEAVMVHTLLAPMRRWYAVHRGSAPAVSQDAGAIPEPRACRALAPERIAGAADQLPLPRPAQGGGDDKRSDLPSRFPSVRQFTLIGRTVTILRNMSPSGSGTHRARTWATATRPTFSDVGWRICSRPRGPRCRHGGERRPASGAHHSLDEPI